MAAQLPFEAQQPAERTVARDERRRMVESWVTGEATSRFFKYSGQSWEALKLVIEDTILDAAVINPANTGETELAKARMLHRLRESHGTVSEAFKRARIGVVHGAETMEQLFDTAGADADLTEEEKKVLKGILKEKEKEGGGKWTKEKTGTGVKGNWKQGGGTGNNTNTGGSTWANNNWNNGGGQGNGGGGGNWTNNNNSWTPQQGGQGQMQFSGQAALGNRSNYREQQRARFPCDNCGQMGHWRSEIVCPNYHVFLATQQAAAAAYHNNRSGGQGAGGNINHQASGNSGAVVPYKGIKHIVCHIYSFMDIGHTMAGKAHTFGQQ